MYSEGVLFLLICITKRDGASLDIGFSLRAWACISYFYAFQYKSIVDVAKNLDIFLLIVNTWIRI
jgi:hypothetical protein